MRSITQGLFVTKVLRVFVLFSSHILTMFCLRRYELFEDFSKALLASCFSSSKTPPLSTRFFYPEAHKKKYNRKPEARSVRRASNKKATKHTFYLTTQHKTQTNSQEYNCLHSSNNCFTEYLIQNLINNQDN